MVGQGGLKGVLSRLPMYEDSTSSIQAFLDKSICSREKLQQVFVFDIVHLDQQVLVRLEEFAIRRVAKYRKHMCDVSFFELFSALERKESGRDASQ
jgi:hypothetical protein